MSTAKAEYSYDADGKRIVSDTEEGRTYFVFSYSGKVIYEESIGSDGENKVTSYVYALSKQMARVEGVIGGEGEVIYYHHDNLGSTRLMTDEDGEVVFDQDYLPFGGDLAVVGDLEPNNDIGEKYKYTGQRQEVSIGLYYYGARFYDPDLGRFITEDTYAGVLVNPQGQNIYVYVMNNPMKYVDPSGHKAEENNSDISFDEYWDSIIQLNSLNINNLMLEVPYSDVDKPSPLQMHGNFVTKTGLGMATGKMLGPLGDSISEKVGNKFVGDITNKSIDYLAGKQINKLAGTMTAEEDMRKYLTKEAVAVWNQILKGSKERNIFIFNYGNRSTIKNNIFEVQFRNVSNSLGNYTKSLIRGGSVSLLTVSPSAGYLIESANTFYDREFPVSYKKGDVVWTRKLEYMTRKDIEIFTQYKFLTYRYMTLHSIERNNQIYQSYLRFNTRYAIFNDENKVLPFTIDPKERTHGATW